MIEMTTRIHHAYRIVLTGKNLLFVVACFLLLFTLDVLAQIPQPTELPPDSLETNDSVYIPTPSIPLLGSADRTLHGQRILPESVIVFSDYRYLGNLLTNFPGVYIQDLGSPGQMHGLNIDGVSARSVAVLSDGILLNDPLTGAFDLNQYPTEHIERIEMIPTTRAFLYGINSTGGTVNLVTHNYNAAKPISQIRYSETAYENTYFDGFITQDVRRDLNVTLGISHPSFGGRYKNNVYDAWNGRAKIRYNLSRDVNFFVSEVYNQSKLDLNGGIDSTTPSANWYEPNLAYVRSEYAYEKMTRHDLQAGIAARLLPDSTDIATLILFHSTNFREYREDNYSDPFAPVYIKQDHRTQWFGVRMTQHLTLIGNSLDLGAEVQNRGVLASSVMGQRFKTYVSVWGKDEITPFTGISLDGYARIDNNDNKSHLSFGADAAYGILWDMELVGGFSHSYRFPTFQELYWQDSIVSSTHPGDIFVETHDLLEAGIRMEGEQLNFSVKAFQRTIDHASMTLQPTQFYPFPKVVFDLADTTKLEMRGVDATIGMRLGWFYAEGNMQYLQMKKNGKDLSQLPDLSGSGGVYYWNELFDGSLNLKAGLRGRVFNGYDGMDYNPQAQMYVPSSSWHVKTAGIGDVVILAKLGDATLHIIWENLLSLNYYTVPIYPMPDRAIKFGLTWEFLN